MSASTATIESGPTHTEPLTPVAVRALHWAAEWYPTGTYAVTGVTDARATVLVEVDDNVHIVHYDDCDRGRCAICGRPL
jgi:hypothetical protein